LPEVERLDHVALFSKDVTKTAAFYCQWAGMEVIHARNDGADVRWLRKAGDALGLIIVLLQSDDGRPGGRMDHFGFHVPARADVDAIAQRAKDEGVPLEGPSYAGPVVGYYCVIQDPDGNELEFSCEQLKA